MITPEIARSIAESIKGVTPVFAERGPKKGVDHVDKTYRFEYSARHIAIVRNATQAGITVYLNQTSLTGKKFPANSFQYAVIDKKYPRGYQGETGDRGLASSAARLPSIDPKYNDSMRISVSTQGDFHRLLNWYFSINEQALNEVIEENQKYATEVAKQKTHEISLSDSDQKSLEHDTVSLSQMEREAVVKVRYGQGAFRSSLIAIAGEVCWMSGIEGKELLIASHIQPWAHSEKNPDARWCSDNGLLLSCLWDAAFDSGLVSFDERWQVITSPMLSLSAKKQLGIFEGKALPEQFRNKRRAEYLTYHRLVIFKPAGKM